MKITIKRFWKKRWLGELCAIVILNGVKNPQATKLNKLWILSCTLQGRPSDRMTKYGWFGILNRMTKKLFCFCKYQTNRSTNFYLFTCICQHTRLLISSKNNNFITALISCQQKISFGRNREVSGCFSQC